MADGQLRGERGMLGRKERDERHHRGKESEDVGGRAGSGKHEQTDDFYFLKLEISFKASPEPIQVQNVHVTRDCARI